MSVSAAVSKGGYGIVMIHLVAFAPALAAAEASKGNLAVTYVFLRDNYWDHVFQLGGSVAGTLRVHRWLGAAAEAAISTHTEDFSPTGGGTYDQRHESFQLGARVSPLSGRVRPYLELLSGVNRWRIRETRLSHTGWEFSADFSVQPGLGTDFLVARRLAVRLGGNLRFLFKRDNRFGTSYRTRLYRVEVGLAFHFRGD